MSGSSCELSCMATAAVPLRFRDCGAILWGRLSGRAVWSQECTAPTGISSCYNSLHTVIKHTGVAVTGKTARYLPAVCLVLASAVKSLAFKSNTLFHLSLSQIEKTHLIAGANVLFLLPAHSHQRPTRTVTSNRVSFTFIDDASFVARETKQHIESRATENQFFTHSWKEKSQATAIDIFQQ